ncbi:MAG TPA: lytic transglycosylase domain-containing protein [Candidatus Dormibacteraeota bacterium]
MRLLRVCELGLACGTAGLLLVSSYHPFPPTPVEQTGKVLSRSVRREPAPAVRQRLDEAAQRHGLPPHLVEAVAYWESGWDPSKVSETGAVGLMQIQPEVAAELAPRLVGHPVDIQQPGDNADLGAAILRAYINDQGGDVDRGLAAYYQGPRSIADDGMFPDTVQYVDGIDGLRQLLDSNQPLPPPDQP